MAQSFLGGLYAEETEVRDISIIERPQTRNLRVRPRRRKPQRWDLSMVLRGNDRTLADRVFSHQLDNLDNDFALEMPQIVPGSDAELDVMVSQASPGIVGHAIVSVASTVGGVSLLHGRFVGFAGHSKVYRFQGDDRTVGAGTTRLALYPALVEPVAQGEKMTLAPPLRAVYAHGAVRRYRRSRDHYAAFDLFEYLV